MPPPTPAAPTRRATLASLLALGAASLGLAERPDPAQWRVRADFEPARAIWLGYDAGHVELSAALARALQPYVALKLLTTPEQAAEARAALQAHGVRTEPIELLTAPLQKYFLRDTTVFATGPAGQQALLVFRWNHYGMPAWCRMRHEGDRRQVAACSAGREAADNGLVGEMSRLAGTHMLASPLYIEGGGIEVNGQGLIIANEALLVQRNLGRPRTALERDLLALPGVRKVLWLPAGLAEDPPLRATITGQHVAWGTGGHTDQFVRFADARTVLLAWPDDDEAEAHPVARLNRLRMQRNATLLAGATDTNGQRLRVLKVPMPRIVERRVVLSASADNRLSDEWTADDFPARDGRRQGDAVMQVAAATYLNFVVANGTVVLPDYLPHGTPPATQLRVQRVFEQAFPGRRLQWVDAIGANWVGGGPHCATLNEPLNEG